MIVRLCILEYEWQMIIKGVDSITLALVYTPIRSSQLVKLIYFFTGVRTCVFHFTDLSSVIPYPSFSKRTTNAPIETKNGSGVHIWDVPFNRFEKYIRVCKVHFKPHLLLKFLYDQFSNSVIFASLE